jgi:hypothetical protein
VVWEGILSKTGGDRPIRQSRNITEAPASAVRKSIAHLRRSIVEREKRQNLLWREQAKVFKQLNAPIIKLIEANPNYKVARAALNDFQTQVMSGDDLPRLPTDEVQWWGLFGNRVALASPPYHHYFVQPDTSNLPDGNVSDPDGNIIISSRPESGGATAWGGVGFGFVPEPDVHVLRVHSYLSYSYHWSTTGSLFNAHSEGRIGLYVHRFNPNWALEPADTFEMLTDLWVVTSDTGHDDIPQGRTTLINIVPIDPNSAYLIWTIAKVYCNSSTKFVGSSRGSALLQIKCGLMAGEVNPSLTL